MIVPCPVCKKEVQWKDNPYRPFCSDRCKLIDLGEWAMEKHAIPSDHADVVSSDKEKKQTINDEEED